MSCSSSGRLNNLPQKTVTIESGRHYQRAQSLTSLGALPLSVEGARAAPKVAWPLRSWG